MGSDLETLVAHYRNRRPPDANVVEQLKNLHQAYSTRSETSLLSTVAATGAVNAVFLDDSVDVSQVNPQMREAFARQWPGESLDARLAEAVDGSEESLIGFVSAWKGVYFEVLVRDRLNAGERVGDISLKSGQYAELAGPVNQPGFDLAIRNADGTVAEEIQLKATQSLAYVKQALERYPEIKLLATDEVGDASSVDEVFGSGIEEVEIRDDILSPMEDAFDSTVEDLAERVFPGLPVILVMGIEGRAVLVGRKTFEEALSRVLQKSLRSGTAMAIGALAAMAGASFFSLPATFMTGVGVERYFVQRQLLARVREDQERLLLASKSLADTEFMPLQAV